MQRAVGQRDLGAGRNPDHEILAIGAVAQRPLPVAGALRPEVSPALERLQVAQGVVAEQNDGPAMPAVPAVGPAPGHVGLAAEGHAPVPATARLHEDPRFVGQHQRFL